MRLRKRCASGLIFIDEYGHRRDYTFAEIAAQSRRYAAVLRAFGVQQDESVAVHLPTTAKCIFTLLALQRLRAAAVLGPPQAHAATIISDRKYRADIDASRDQHAPEARLGFGQKIVAVNGREYSADVLYNAVKEAQQNHRPIELLVEKDDMYRTISIPYYGGLRYPHLVRVTGTPDRLSEVVKPRRG
jgi:acyl-coenzyme A synthetase/AMP-(fatty) acid ligase